MTITVVCDIFGEENNGTLVATMNLIRFLQGQGHTVRILCADQSKKGEQNFFVVSNQSFGKPLNAVVRRVGVTLAKPDYSVIEQALQGVDHVHIMFPLGLGCAAIKVARKMNLSVTAGFHMQAENMTGYVGLNKSLLANICVYKYIYNHLYRYVDAIHYPTDFIRDVFEKRIGRRTNGYVISNGVHSYMKKREVDKPEEYKDKIVILTTGRYSREKSQDTLIKAVRYSAHRDRIQLILAGQGIKEKEYRRLAKKLPLQPIFRLYSREEMAEVLNYCDMYVHPAIAELEGIACLESMACGKLTIVSDSEKSATKGFAIDGKCIFKSKDAKDLARVIDYWIERPAEREVYAQRYAASPAVQNQEDCMRKMEQMIFEVHAKKQCAKQFI